MSIHTRLVNVTIDGKVYQVPPGVTSLVEMVGLTGINKKTAKLTVGTAAPAQASVINGNDSYNIIGGEVMTSTVGA
jgi:hypothetical protein